MRKVISAVGVVALLASGTYVANAAQNGELLTYGIHSTLAAEPEISEAGGGLFYPVVNKVVTMDGADFDNLVLSNEKGTQYPIENVDGTYLVDGDLTYRDVYSAVWASGVKSLQLPFILEGPMNVGHINFKSGSAALDAGDKEILDAIANEVAKTGLTGIYLVGMADLVGSYEGNLAISLKRVNATKKYLMSALSDLGVTDVDVVTEYMGDLLAKGTPGKSNLEDRRVEVTIYPIV